MKGLKVRFEDYESIRGILPEYIHGEVISEPYSKLLPFEIKEVGDLRQGVSEGSVTCVVVMSKAGYLYEDIAVKDLEVLDE